MALWQANHVQDQLRSLGVHCSIHIIRTKGDNIQHLSFDKIEGKGFFTKEIEEALLRQEIDIAVHSHKDLETTSPPGLVIAAVSDRADPRELLLIRPDKVDAGSALKLRKNAVVGTSSSRRKAQILQRRPDVAIRDIRGNVPTRVQKLRDGQFDAILLAKAGIDRIKTDLTGLEVVVLETSEMVPAPAQGVLAIQCRESDKTTIRLLMQISNEDVREKIRIERTVLNRLNGGCQLPLGVFAESTPSGYNVLVAYAQSWDGRLKTFSRQGSSPDELIESILQEIQS